MKSQHLFSLKLAIFTICTMIFTLLGTASFAQDIASYQPSSAEIAKYGAGFPAYCTAYSTRPECLIFFGNQPIPVEPDPCYQTGGYQPGCIPQQQNHCLAGDTSPSCFPQFPIPTSYPPIFPPGCILSGPGVMSCEIPPIGYPQIYPPTYPQPYPVPEPPPIICVDGVYHSECYPQPYPIPYPHPIVCPDGTYGPYCTPQPYPIPVPPPLPIPPPPPSVYDFRLPTPPPSVNCQYRYSPHCLPIATMKAFHHSYAISPAIPSYRVGENLEYRINSPYSGYLYVFVEEADGRLKVLYPNAHTGDAPYVQAGTVMDFPGSGANYSLGVTAPYGLHRLFFVVTSKPMPRYLDENIRYQGDLDRILLDLGLTANIYHGYGETAFDVVY